jgi:polar amino acid transport system substrate-binding protein
MGMLAMARPIDLRGFLCAAVAVVWALSGRASPAEPLRLVIPEVLDDARAPSFEVYRQVFAAMGQEVSIESFPSKRAWMMIVRGEREGMPNVIRTSERERFCSFPDEPLRKNGWVFFVRTADVGKLKFSSFDDLVGHDVAVNQAIPQGSEQPPVFPEPWKLLREHNNLIETDSNIESLRMLGAGRVDYALMGLGLGRYYIARMGLSGEIEPILSPRVMDGDVSVCFSKARVSPSLVDAFSRALKQFKQTDAYKAILNKYVP